MTQEHTALATLATGDVPPDGTRELLVFDLAGDSYALPLSCVREIMRIPPITEVPRAPEGMLGVISARGAVTTVVDLRKRLHLAEAPLSGRARVLLVQHFDEVLGLLVDAVQQVQRLTSQEIELASVLGGSAPGHLYGIGRPSGRANEPEAERKLLLLLDPEALLGFDRSSER